MPQIKIYYRDVSSLERLGVNAVNAANFAGRNTGIQLIKGQLYKGAAGTVKETLSDADKLSFDDRTSSYPGSAGDTARNVLVLDNEDLQIALFDAKIKVTQSNTIVETALTGRKGSVKEYIQAKDYTIDVKGNVFSNSRYGFPVDEVGLLRKIMETPDSFDVVNVLLNKVFDVTKVVCKTVDFDMQSNQKLNLIAYHFVIISDEDYDLEIE
ncbi:MAG: DUF6046 domain-containing protein [Bacteroidota bacterium]|nr:DUF6046 domain-containing protein [Bacteroidota bacterium]